MLYKPSIGCLKIKFSGVHVAAYFGLREIMVDFCKVEEHIELRDESGRTPLSWAAGYGHESIVQMIIEQNNININSKDSGGKTPLSWNGHEAVVRLLIGGDDVDINSKDNYGTTPLLWAAASGHVDVVWLLIEGGDVDINAKGIHPSHWRLNVGMRLLCSCWKINLTSGQGIQILYQVRFDAMSQGATRAFFFFLCKGRLARLV